PGAGDAHGNARPRAGLPVACFPPVVAAAGGPCRRLPPGACRSVPAAPGVLDVVVVPPGVADGPAGLGPEQARVGPTAFPVARQLRFDLLEALVGMLVARPVSVAIGRRVVAPVAAGRVVRRVAEDGAVVRLVVVVRLHGVGGVPLHGRAI